LTLRIPTGKRCALIGQNGCGKTTLFLLANGLYKPQQGMVRWQGKPLQYDRASLMALRQQVGLVFQDPEQQLVASTVEEDISYGLCNLGLPEDEIAQRVGEAISRFWADRTGASSGASSQPGAKEACLVGRCDGNATRTAIAG
jgi:cobalt/nickel transport system ATP-binding protein